MVHIAAIAIGLLLALGLEKLAEYVHERRLLNEARRELAAEVAENRRVWSLNVIEASIVKRALDADLKAIQAVRSAENRQYGQLLLRDCFDRQP